MNPKTKIILTTVFGLVWGAAAVFGAHALFKYETRPGQIGHVSSVWPAHSSISLANDRPTLLMFAHPQCPCTRASISELASIVAHTQSKARVLVLFYTPRDSGEDWRNRDTCRSAAQIPGVTVVADVDGAEAERFGAKTSGDTFLFDASGHLLFHGGITASRGHAGDNVGEDSITALISNQTTNQSRTLVFGCSLRQREQTKTCLK